MIGTAATGEMVRLEFGPEPLRLARVVADVPCVCPVCDAAETQPLITGAHWWDREASARQREHAGGRACGRCGTVTDLPVPLVQYRDLDAADLVVGLPLGSAADSDKAWIAAIVGCLRERLNASDAVVSVRLPWWPFIDTVPLGPALAGLAGPPEFGEPREERARWLASTRASLPLPDIPGAMGRFITASSVADARQVVAAEPALVDPRWKLTIELAGMRLMAQQETDEQREVVEYRLSRLRRMALEPADATRDQGLPGEVREMIDRAIALGQDDPGRLTALRDTVARLRPYGRTRMLAAALTSLIAALIADAGRGPAMSEELAALAREGVEVAAEVFGPDSDVTLNNQMNALLIEQERPDLTPAGLAAGAREYGRLTASPVVHRSGHLVDVLINLAAATDRRTDLGRGDRQELTLRMFEDAEYIARLTRPDDQRTRLLCVVNQAAVLRQRVAGAPRRNAERAWSLLEQAWQIERDAAVLHPVERVQLTVNRLNAAYTLRSAGSANVAGGMLAAAAREVAAAAEAVHGEHETALTAMFAAGSVLLDLYAQASRDGQRDPSLAAEARKLLLLASQRADRAYPPGHRIRLTARVNLAAAYGAPAADGGHLDADRCAELLLSVADEAGTNSPEHTAIALTNLAGLRAGQGRWEEAAQCYGQARQSRHAMIEQAAVRATRLGEVIATGDLAAREALAYAVAGKPGQAVEALEQTRVNLLRHRHRITQHIQPGDQPGRTIVHLAACGIGTVGIVRRTGQPAETFTAAIPGALIQDVLHDLVTAPTRIARLIAHEEVARALGGLTDAVAKLAGEQTTELCVVACGPLAGAPLHAIAGSDGKTWTDRWQVRYWPSATVAAHLPPPQAGHPGHAIVVANPSGDLPLAAAELEAVRGIAGTVTTPPAGWSVRSWLRTALPDADLAHFACHARADLIDPTGSHFELGPAELLTVADLLDGPDLRHLQLVIASACQAGVPAANAPDELLGIGYGLVHAGAQAAITTLWEVNDTPAALLIARLYKELRDGLEPAAALHRAQRWLAAIDNRQLSALCARRQHGGETWLPIPLAESLAPDVASADSDQPFRHPADWGAFTYLGR